MAADTPKTLADWQLKAASLSFETRAFINGEFVAAADGSTLSSINPATGHVLAEVASCADQDAELATQAARATFESGVWSRCHPSQRKRVLLRLAELVETHRDELALLDTLDMGKPISSSLGDLAGTVACLRYQAECIDKLYGEVAPTGDRALGLVLREPMGVIAAIVPWNFPLMMTSWKIAPALAAGNSVILKPSEKSPLSALRLAHLAKEAGIPDGVFQVLPGYGHTVGKALALSMQVDGLAFTGSTGVGKQLMQYAGQSNLKRVFLECGGKSPNIVFADCQHLDAVAQSAAEAIFHNQGEVCIAGSRLLVENSIRKDFVARVVKAAEHMQPGDPLDPASFMGAMVDEAQYQRVLEYIRQGESEGATLKLGGEPSGSNGYFLPPTVFDDVTPDMCIGREEIFGPVLSVFGFDSEEQAVQIANDTVYGLTNYVQSQDGERRNRLARQLRSGMVEMNGQSRAAGSPFGGMKQSGNGREGGMYGIEDFTEIKAVSGWAAE